jgi:O-antigen/teichoic acid export membrane protein
LRGLLEAYQRFDLVNLVRAPTSALNYLGPLAVLPFSRSLFGVVVVLLATRVAAFAIHAGMCLRVFPQLRQHCAVDPLSGRALLSFGGWLTLSNLAAPLLLYLGRFVLAATVSIEAVAYFSTPYDVMINLLLIPGVFSSVLFPVYTQTAQVRPQDAHRLYRKSVLQLFAIMLPICGLAVVLAESVLAWWIDPEFAAKSHRVAELIAIGVLINSVGHLSQGMVQACGRPDLTAKLHVCELILYVPYLYWLVAKFSIEGAGMAWVVRVTISTVVLHVLARTCIGRLRNTALAGAGA